MKSLKCTVLTVIGPSNGSREVPSDLELHLLGRQLIESNNPNIDFFWIIGTKESWGNNYPIKANTKFFQVENGHLPGLEINHSSYQHGLLLDYLTVKVDSDCENLLILDPDCFVLGKYNLEKLLTMMHKDKISFIGTGYGINFPKSYYRDFPTLFFLVINLLRVDKSKLLFQIDKPEIPSEKFSESKGHAMQSGKYVKSKVMCILSLIFKKFLIIDFSLWLGFMFETFTRKSMQNSRDTGHKLRDIYREISNYIVLPTILPENFYHLGDKKLVAKRKNSKQEYGTKRYFRNHGVFEGWESNKKSWLDFFLYSIVNLSGFDRDVLRRKFPTDAIVSSAEINNRRTVEDFYQVWPRCDLWAFKSNVFALHIGNPTKKSEKFCHDSYNLMNFIYELNQS